MADQKISELNEKTTPATTDIMVLVDIEASPDEAKKMTWYNVVKSAPIMIAASDATAAEKQVARASGGAVCDGVDDQVEIDAANDAANGAEVGLLGKTFNITSLTLDNCTLRGSWPDAMSAGYSTVGTSGTTINTTGGIQLNQGGLLRDVRIKTEASFSGIALKVGYAGGAGLGGDPGWRPRIVDNVFIDKDDVTQGTAMQVAYAGCLHFGSILIRRYAVGLHLYQYGETSYVNGNLFDHVNCIQTKLPIKLEAVTHRNWLQGNTFQAVQIQPNSGWQNDPAAIQLINVERNFFMWCAFWDWAGSYGWIDTGRDLAEDLDTIETDVTCDGDASGSIPVGTVIKIDSEYMKVTATGVILTVIRGWHGTTAASHAYIPANSIFKTVPQIKTDSESNWNYFFGYIDDSGGLYPEPLLYIDDQGYNNIILSDRHNPFKQWSTWIDYTDTYKDIAILYNMWLMAEVEIFIETPFNAGTSNAVQVGVSGWADKIASADASASKRATVTYNAGSASLYSSSAALRITYAQSGTPATAGKAFVVVRNKF